METRPTKMFVALIVSIAKNQSQLRWKRELRCGASSSHSLTKNLL
jgi:hypothetical protein